MPIDPARAVGAPLPARELVWTSSDVLLYHLALGAGADPLDPGELRYAYERDLQVLPTFGVVAGDARNTAPPTIDYPGVDIDLAGVLHAGQGITTYGPIPTDGRAIAEGHVTDVFDKGSAAVIRTETRVSDASGSLLWTSSSSIFVRGEGGFGGDRGPAQQSSVPDGPPALTITTPTRPEQALLYRLLGDRNPLHCDPETARAAGFEAPILHGMCTYGIVAKSLTHALLDGDVSPFGSFDARFTGVVYPGETLQTSVWTLDDGSFAFTTAILERPGSIVLSDGSLVLAGAGPR
jgi:acyl dehydratase